MKIDILRFLCQCSALLQQTSDEGDVGKGWSSLPQVVGVAEGLGVGVTLDQSRIREVRHFRGHICNHQNHKNTTMMPSLVTNTESDRSLCKRFLSCLSTDAHKYKQRMYYNGKLLEMELTLSCTLLPFG